MVPVPQGLISPKLQRFTEDDAGRIGGLVLLRALVVSGLFGAAMATSLSGSADELTYRSQLYAFLTVAYVSVALEFCWILIRRRLRVLAWVHATTETLLAGWLVALTGGPDGAFTFLLLLSTVHGALAAGSGGAFASASLAAAILAALATGITIPGLGVVVAHSDPSRVMVAVCANSAGCFATAALSAYLIQRLQRTRQALSARELELRQLGELYVNVVQSLGSGLMTLGPSLEGGDSLVTLINSVGAEILGVPLQACQGKPLSVLAPELAQALRSSSGGQRRGECAMAIRGRQLLLGFSVSHLRGADGEPMGHVVVFQDLTDLKRLEEAVRRQGHLASLGELSAGLAHEIRNPLAALSGAVQMLATAPSSEEDRRLLDVLRRESAHLETLVSDFLVFARPPPPAMGEADLSQLVEESLEAFRADGRASERNLLAHTEPVQARFDAGQMRQVIWNLMRNAAEATGPGGTVRVSVVARNGAAVLEVADDGPGVPGQVASQIFEPFFTTKEKGTGLGLALVARIVGSHGGTVDFDRNVTRGARFVVTLPRAGVRE
jgi:two-component system sensor histidine kinase PilS (NtrC family)